METFDKCIERLGELILAKPYLDVNYFNKRFNELGLLIESLRRNKQIGVICLNMEDFHQWRIDSKLKPTSKDTSKFFIVDNRRYYCVTRPEDACGISFDEIIETMRAYHNEYYDKIVERIIPTLQARPFESYNTETQEFINEYRNKNLNL